MQKTAKLRLLAAGIAVTLLTSAYYRTESAPTMTSAAQALLASLTPEQISKTTFKFEDEERFNWHFIPKPRKGLPLREMTAPQKHLAQALLSAGLSQRGYIKAITIMSMEDILRIMEKDDGVRRNAEGYFFSIFGEPSEKGTWGYRMEGHHISLNFTLSNGKVVGSPNFYGTNPGEVKEGPRKGLRVLGQEEERGRELVKALTADQKKVAIVAPVGYKDILTMANRVASLKGEPSGLGASKLNKSQKAMLQAILDEYAGNMPDQIAQARQDQIKKAGDNLQFAWAGGLERGEPHYYRVQGPDFLVEYDNTQNNANHVHSVWRDFTGDFGGDLLKEHYRASHTK